MTSLPLAAPTVLELFAGPGGWDQGARDAGLDLSILGLDRDADACATARAAGFLREQADVLELNPARWSHVTGLIASPPCPTFSASGKGTGRVDMQHVLDAVAALGWWEADEYGEPAAWVDLDWQEVVADLVEQCQDIRTVLAAVAVHLALKLPRLQWVAMEQVPTAEYLFEDVAAELLSSGWEWADVLTFDATELGLPARRRRVYLVAHRTCPRHIVMPRIESTSMAQVLGWPAGHRVITRGNRRPTGGGSFSADGPSWGLTEKARSWVRDDGHRLTIEEASILH